MKKYIKINFKNGGQNEKGEIILIKEVFLLNNKPAVLNELECKENFNKNNSYIVEIKDIEGLLDDEIMLKAEELAIKEGCDNFETSKSLTDFLSG